MQHISRWNSWVVALAITLLAGSPAFAQAELSGQTSGGAFFRMLQPAGWQPEDGLVIWNHGYQTAPIGPDVDLGPLVDLHLAQGYAVAASSYSTNQWALETTVDDLRDLVEVFEDWAGEPEEIYLTGLSMGGLVTAQAIERGRLGNVVGAMPFCGIVSPGVRWWDQLLDHRLIYDFVCGDVPGAAVPGGAFGLPVPAEASFNPTPANPLPLLLRIDACLGVLFPPGRTAEQQARMDRMVELTKVPEFFAWTNMFFTTFGISDLVYEKFGGLNPLDNSSVIYPDPELDAGIERVEADPRARRRLIRSFSPRGKVRDVKVVSLHTDKDGLVLVEAESEYAEVVPAENLTTGIAVEAVPSHCGLTAGELVGGWEALRSWVAGSPQPTAADLQASCLSVVAQGLADGPCRIEPDAVPGSLDARVPPRDSDDDDEDSDSDDDSDSDSDSD